MQTLQERVESAADAGVIDSTIKLHRMGSDQWSILSSLCERSWSDGCGWTWSNRSTTVKLLDSLVKRNLATVTYLGDDRPNRRRPHYIAHPDVAAIWGARERERQLEQTARWQAKEREQAIANQERQARQYAIDKLIEEHQGEYIAWHDWYINTHPHKFQ